MEQQRTERTERKCKCGQPIRGMTMIVCTDCRRKDLYKKSYSSQFNSFPEHKRSHSHHGWIGDRRGKNTHPLVKFSQGVTTFIHGSILVVRGIVSGSSFLYAALLDLTALFYELKSKHHDLQKSFGREALRHEIASDRCYDTSKDLRSEARRIRKEKEETREQGNDQNSQN